MLLVEDDPQLGQQVVDHLSRAGLEACWLRNGEQALKLDPADFDLVILDLMLPGAYGLDVLKHLRTRTDIPVLILSARHDTPDKVKALQLGADDFVTKPFWPEELLARVQARLRRPLLERQGRVRVGSLTLDLDGRALEVDGEDIELTRVEFDLLAALARRRGAAVPRAWLVDHVLDPERDGTERTLDVHVSRLRKKLGEAASQIATVWGVGYRLQEKGST